MKYARIVLLSIMLLLFASQCDRQHSAAYLPPEGKILTFAHQLSYPGTTNQNMPQAFGFAVYASLFQDVSVELTPGNTVKHLRLLLDATGTQLPLILLRLTNTQLAGLPDGEFDQDIQQLAATLKNYGRPVYLAPGFEVNNPMYTLASANYVKSFRYVVEKMRSLQVNNVSYVWCVIGMKPRWEEPITLEECYPGDEYVNWLGLTVHNISPHHYPEDGFFEASIYDEVAAFADAHDLPMMICESSTRSVDKNFALSGDSLWIDWYEPFFAMIEKYDIRALSHIFYDYKDDVILNRWREKMNAPTFIHAQENPAKMLQGK